MRIAQAGFPLIGFHLERGKTGIALTAEAPIAAQAVGGKYRYSIDRYGEGLYLEFFKMINGRRYGVFDDGDLSQFTMLANDDVYLSYEKTTEASCPTSPY